MAVALVPAFLWSFRRAAVRAARDADLVHAHWLAAGAVAATLGKPYVVQVWGTDVELARRVPWLARPVLRRARLVLAASSALAAEAGALGAREVRVVPSGVAIPDEVGEPEEPPHVLYVGRLSEEKGVLELVEACGDDLPLVVVGDGPLRPASPSGRLRPAGPARAVLRAAAVVCVPSRREGYGVVAREAMARPAGRRDRRRRPPRRRRGRRDRPARAAGDRPHSARRSSGSSATGRSAPSSAPRRAQRRERARGGGRDGVAARRVRGGVAAHDVVPEHEHVHVRPQERVDRLGGVITIGSFSLNDVLSTIGTPVSRSNSSIRRW